MYEINTRDGGKCLLLPGRQRADREGCSRGWETRDQRAKRSVKDECELSGFGPFMQPVEMASGSGLAGAFTACSTASITPPPLAP